MYLVKLRGFPSGLSPLLLFFRERPTNDECPFPIKDDVEYTELPQDAHRRPDGEASNPPSFVARHMRFPNMFREYMSVADLPEGFVDYGGVTALIFRDWAEYKANPASEGREKPPTLRT
jgi:hypothetical protein